MDRYVDLTCPAPVRLGDIFRAYCIVVASLLLNCCSGGRRCWVVRRRGDGWGGGWANECGESHQANMDWVDRALTGPTFLVLSDCYDIGCSTLHR